MRHTICLCCAAIFLAVFARRAAALVVEVPVTAASLKEANSPFTVEALAEPDGLTSFTITYRLKSPEYLVGYVELRDGDRVLLRSSSTAFVREDTATYYLSVAPGSLSSTAFELSTRSFTAGDHPVPLPGGTDYQLKLADFKASPAPARMIVLPIRPLK
jgi:hypothetical protein